jgi:hypothetical protein
MVNMKINEVDNLIVLPNRRNVAVFKKKRFNGKSNINVYVLTPES